MLNKQVDKNAYEFNKYLHFDRWASYYFQIKEILDLKPWSVLEVGVGDGLVGSYLKNNTNIDYKTLDIAQDLGPDFIGSVNEIPLQNNSYDVVCAFQVLEHLPFDQFDKSLKEINRVSKKYAIISLPHFGPAVRFKFKIPFLPEIKGAFKIPFPVNHNFNGQHYWEIGKKGYAPVKIRRIIGDNFTIVKEFVPFDNQYHRFYVLRKK
jgi:SAM-dependent methyltransferase